MDTSIGRRNVHPYNQCWFALYTVFAILGLWWGDYGQMTLGMLLIPTRLYVIKDARDGHVV